MNYFLFGGTSNTGKTQSINSLCHYLIHHLGYQYFLEKEVIGADPSDFQCILIKENKKILIHSPTDSKACIQDLCTFYQAHQDVAIIITAIRNIDDPMRSYLEENLPITSEDFCCEIPLGKVITGPRRKDNLIWYLEHIDSIAEKLIVLAPFSA